MEVKPVFLVLADISGYTWFIRQHKMALLHAEAIITELLESVIDSSAFPLTVNKLEGDAALFYAVASPTPEAAREILRQVLAFFAAFYARQGEVVERSLCSCEGCTQAGQLDLKAVIHVGEAAFKRVRQFEELAGEQVILAHRLLKSDVANREHLLMSEPFYRLRGGTGDLPVEPLTQEAEGIGRVKVYVHYPGRKNRVPPPPSARTTKILQLARVNLFALVRLMGLKRRAAFANLPGLRPLAGGAAP